MSDRGPCSVEGCDGRAWARTWCRPHYRRWEMRGDPTAPKRPPHPRAGGRRPQRQAPLPRKSPVTPLETPCREWWGPHERFGYGRIFRNGKNRFMHRWIWTLVMGPIPEGMQVMHRCDNPPCFRLDHLQLGSAADNSADRVVKGRTKKRVSS